MGNQNAKEKEDEKKMSKISTGLRTLRHSMESLNGGSTKSTLNSNEKEVWDVLRRSKRGKTRKQALSLLEDITDLRDKDRQSVRDSSLDNGAVESNSIVAGDVRKYDRNRQRDKNIEELTDIKLALAKLRPKVYGRDAREDTADSCRQLDGLLARLDRLQIKPNSKLQQYTNEYRHCIEEYFKKLADKQALHQVAINKETREQISTQTHQLAVQDELAVIRAQVESFKDQCSHFHGTTESHTYKELDQSLRKLWDQLGGIKEETLTDERDEIIGMIALTLKELNRKTIESARSMRHEDQLGSLVETFLKQFEEIEVNLSSNGAQLSGAAYRTLNDIQKRIYDVLSRNDCHLVKAKITPSLTRKPMAIYLSQDCLPQETSLVYIDEDSSNDGSLQRDKLRPNRSMPNLRKVDIIPAHQQVQYASIQPGGQKEPTPNTEESDTRSVLDTLNFESIATKLSVELYESNDVDKYNELDGRLIELLIAIEELNGKCSPDNEMFRQSIKKRIKTTFSKLSAKARKSPGNRHQPEQDVDANVQLGVIRSINGDLVGLKGTINESYPWRSSSPNFHMLEAQLRYIIDRLLAIPSGGCEAIEDAKAKSLADAQDAVNLLNAQKFKSDFAGTEV